ncbi:MAG: hypothetical protein WCX46_00515 [Candidatus Paceibacterota bacterium]
MAWEHLKGIIVILIVLWLVWFFAGGPEKGQTDKPFIKPAAPLDTGETYGPQ